MSAATPRTSAYRALPRAYVTVARNLWLQILVLGVGVAMFVALFAFTSAVLGVMVLALLAHWFFATRIELHDEGVMMRMRAGNELLAFRDILSVIPITGEFARWTQVGPTTWFVIGLRLSMRGGRVVDITTDVSTTKSELARDALVSEIVDGLERYRTANPAPTHGLARDGRTPEEWRAAVERLAASEQGYRQPELSNETLWRMAEDKRAEPSARLGAIVALRTKTDDADCERLRVVVEACASPRLRVAMNAVLEGVDDEEVEAALEKVD